VADELEITSISLSEVVRRLAASRRLVPICAAIGLAVGTGIWLVTPRTYVSSATLLPSSGEGGGGGMGGGLLNLAGSLGISVPGAAAPESHLFPTILKSERVIRNALKTRINPADPREGTLYDVVVDDGYPETVRLEKAAEDVRHEILRVGVDEETGVVRLVVRMTDPVLANRTAQIFLDELSRYLRHERTAEARENRLFVEGRRSEVAKHLEQAENEFREFREANRKINNSPELLLEEDRLSRGLRVQEEIFLELSRQFEIARIEEQKATPVLEILDPPTIRYAPKNPKLPIFGGVGLLIGVFLGSLVAVAFENPRATASGVLASAQTLLGMRGRAEA
jgi:uncharacterized protein involved in exopolysaccharide biosynthesis